MRNKNRRKRNNRKKDIFILKIDTKKVIVPTVIIFVIIMFSTIFALTNSINEKIISGITINHINVSGLTIDEAYEKMKQNLKEQIEKNIKVGQGEYETTISLEQLEVNYDIVDGINQAYKIGRNKNIIISNYEIIITKLFHKNIEKEIKINEEELDNAIDDISAKIPNLLVDSSYYIEGKELIISKGKIGNQVKTEEFKNIIKKAIINQINGTDSNKIEIPVEEKIPAPIDMEKVQKEIYKEPKNAYYEENPFKLYKEEDGIDLKITIEEANKILEDEKEEYVIPLKITKPEIAIKDLKYSEFFPNMLSRFLTRYDESNTNRSTNIKLSSDKINDTILMPGETFSYNKIVGARTIKAGYKEASVYVNGKVVDGIGGGICQVSSTLYNAVLQANLEIVSRKNHYFTTGYVSASRDATVSYGTIDFKFRNTRNYPIKIKCVSQNGICQIEIYGIKEDLEYEVEIEDKITEVIPYTTKEIKTNTLEKGVKEEIQKGVDGCKSEAYRILKLNGQVVSKTLLSKDSYNPLERIVQVGTK